MKEYFGEILGTAIIVVIGCGSLALNTLYGWFNVPGAIALVWGLGVATAIFSSRILCSAHLNPAVSVALFYQRRFSFNQLPFLLSAQLAGGVIGALILYGIFHNDIIQYELMNSIQRDGLTGNLTAGIFTCHYPAPGNNSIELSTAMAATLELAGTFVLMSSILLTEKFNVHRNIQPFLIGLTVTVVILFIGSLTQAGLNPARDLGPRVVNQLFGWQSLSLEKSNYLLVYILAPILGAVLAARLFRFSSN